jgi:hypothetical protein
MSKSDEKSAWRLNGRVAALESLVPLALAFRFAHMTEEQVNALRESLVKAHNDALKSNGPDQPPPEYLEAAAENYEDILTNAASIAREMRKTMGR